MHNCQPFPPSYLHFNIFTYLEKEYYIKYTFEPKYTYHPDVFSPLFNKYFKLNMYWSHLLFCMFKICIFYIYIYITYYFQLTFFDVCHSYIHVWVMHFHRDFTLQIHRKHCTHSVLVVHFGHFNFFSYNLYSSPGIYACLFKNNILVNILYISFCTEYFKIFN